MIHFQRNTNLKSPQFFIPFTLIWVTLIGAFSSLQAQSIQRVEPANWWLDFKDKDVELLVKGKDLSSAKVSVQWPGLTVGKVKKVKNPDYLFVPLIWNEQTAAGTVPITFTFPNGKKLVHNFSLQKRSYTKPALGPIGPQDLMYLLMPDRFANGDPKNDQVAGMLEGPNRNAPSGRHGGDIAGIRKNLPYLKDIGVTVLWINPLLENNMGGYSYHGYAITDLYKIDPRFGSNQDYIDLIKEAQKSGIKIVKDMVLNHIGSNHWLLKEMPDSSWFNWHPEGYVNSNFRAMVVADPHASEDDKRKMVKGWFDKTMPDLNQENPMVAKYLIQNTLWWIETAKLDGIRMDTYPYPDKNFIRQWVSAIMKEYPWFYIVGEVWVQQAALAAYWTDPQSDGYQGNLPTVTDFPLHANINQAFNEGGGWDNGLTRLYNSLAQDFVYKFPEKHLTFLDNHDVNRVALELGKDTAKVKQAITFLLTTRGIPQVYYGTEFLWHGKDGSHPEVRTDFPGGWAGDTKNFFKGEGMDANQAAVFKHFKQLANWRKNNKAIGNGRLTHYIPEDNLYVYFRKASRETVMVVLNGNNESKNLNTTRFAADMQGYKSGKEILTNKTLTDLKQLSIPARGSVVIELKESQEGAMR